MRAAITAIMLFLCGCGCRTTKPQLPFVFTAAGGMTISLSKSPGDWQKDYDKYNGMFFSGKLPKKATIASSDEPTMEHDLAFTTWDSRGAPHVLISRSYVVTENQATMTLLHEMVHIRLHQVKRDGIGDAHGEVFQREMKRLAAAGAFEGSW